ncbi:MAG: AAA family ATPase [Limosilactobacillus sp.]
MDNFILSRQGQEAFATAKKIAAAHHTEVLSTEHVVQAFTETNDTSAGAALFDSHISRVDVRRELKRSNRVEQHDDADPSLNYAGMKDPSAFENRIKKTPVPLIDEPGKHQVRIADRQYTVSDYVLHGLKYGQDLTSQLKSTVVQTQGILLGMVDLQDSNAFWLLLKLLMLKLRGFYAQSYTNIVQIQLDRFRFDDGEETDRRKRLGRVHNNLLHRLDRGNPFILQEYGRDLTKLAREHKLAPVVGRQDEINHLTLILNRRQKSNALLVGPAGVGKTAIVEGVASRIAQGQLPALAGKRIIALDPDKFSNLMFSGWGIEIISQLLNELTAEKDVILFLDEIQNLRLHGGSGIINMMKPALARGDLQLIGATTPLEAQTFFLRDEALQRRFENITVKPLNARQTAAVIKQAITPYENYYQVNYSPAACQLAVDLAQAYVNVALPDSALTILDNAGAMVNVRHDRGAAAKTSYVQQIVQLRTALHEAEKKSLNDKQVNQLKKQMTALQDQFALARNDRTKHRYHTKVTVNDVVEATAEIIGWPLSKTDVAKAQRERTANDASILTLNQRLKQHVIGQDEAIDNLTQALMVAKAGLSKPGAPIGTFFFAGITGTGKTETAKQLAVEAFGTDKALLRFNMPDYLSPLGVMSFTRDLYKGVLEHPHCCILLDEIEKVNTPIFNLLLSIMDDGSFLPSTGLHADFSHTVIIMTSNIGTDKVFNNQVGFGNTSKAAANRINRDIIQRAMEARFAPEFINRLTATVIFNPLANDSLLKIADLLLAQKRQLLLEKNIKLAWDQSVLQYIVDRYADPAKGARPLQRGIDRLITGKIAVMILQGQLHPRQRAQLHVDQNQQVIVKVA